MISNSANMEFGDPIAWIPGWKLFAYLFLFLNYPWSWSGLNMGRISMWSNGFVKNSENNMIHLVPCITQNMEKGAWNAWGAQMIYYLTSMKGISNLYEAANAFTYGIGIVPVLGWATGDINNLLKFIADICGLLVWSNMAAVTNPLVPVEWNFPSIASS